VPDPAKPLNPAWRRRSTRLTISIPITVSGHDAHGRVFTEETQTICVNRHGGRFLLRHAVRMQDPLSVVNPKLGCTAEAAVSWLGERRSPEEPLEVAVSLVKPQNIWGIEFPPEDWKESLAASRSRKQSAPQPEATAPIPPAGNRPQTPSPAPSAPAKVEPPTRPAPATTHSAAVTASEVSMNEIVQSVLARFGEQLKQIADAHANTFQMKMADLVVGHTQAVRKELEQVVGEVVQEGIARLHKQARQDVEHLAKQVDELKSQAAMATEKAIRERLTVALTALDATAVAPPRK